MDLTFVCCCHESFDDPKAGSVWAECEAPGADQRDEGWGGETDEVPSKIKFVMKNKQRLVGQLAR